MISVLSLPWLLQIATTFFPQSSQFFKHFCWQKNSFSPPTTCRFWNCTPKLPKHENSKFDSSTIFHPIKSMYAIFTYNGWLILMATVGIHIIYHTWMLWAYYCPSFFLASNSLQPAPRFQWPNTNATPMCHLSPNSPVFTVFFFENLWSGKVERSQPKSQKSLQSGFTGSTLQTFILFMC